MTNETIAELDVPAKAATPVALGRNLKQRMLLAVRDKKPLLTPDEWSAISGLSRSRVYVIAREVNLRFAQHHETNFPPEICVTYHAGKFAPRPCVAIPTTAIRAAGLDGQRKLALHVSGNVITISGINSSTEIRP